VLEHTRIESFPEQIDDRHATRAIFARLGPQLPDRHDAAKFQLLVNPGSMRSVPYDRRNQVEQVLTTWVADNLDRVAWGDVLRGDHPDVPFPWALWRCLPDDVGVWGPLATVVPVHHVRPEDLEDLRHARMDKVVQDKLPKLAQAGAEERRTVLVLEDKDQEMSGPKLVASALQESVGASWLPDVVYLLYVGTGDPLFCLLYEAGTWAHENPDFRWLSVSGHRLAELRDHPTGWA
jgi:hypothetical protein